MLAVGVFKRLEQALAHIAQQCEAAQHAHREAYQRNPQYAVNGQTGKIVGELPIDKKKAKFWYWFMFLMTGGLTAFIMLLLQIIF